MTTAIKEGSVIGSLTVRRELLQAVILSPLLQMDWRARTSGVLTASDASETGGGVCAASSLTAYGRMMFRGETAATTDDLRDKVALVELCAGIGGARQALQMLGVVVSHHAYSEIDEDARRVFSNQWPGGLDLGDLRTIDRGAVQRFWHRCCHVEVLIVIAGNPCVDLSNLKIGGRGLKGDQ